jgi:enamine deaminase RidA (YjgF/YER057c/UK114 family)
MRIERRLAQLELKLPAARTPAFAYVAVAIHGDTVYVSGQLPWIDENSVASGKLGRELDVQQGRQAARLCALHALASLQAALGDLDRVSRVLKVTGFVASAEGFVQQPAVIDGASELLNEIFGEHGRHARSAIGVAELPRGAAVEVELVVALADQPTR